MWVVLLIILTVPLFFFWSQSAIDLIPNLQAILPEKGKVVVQDEKAGAAAQGVAIPGQPSPWVPVEVKEGYVAWLPSQDNKYRLAVGCRNAEAPTLQITSTNPAQVKVPQTAAMAVAGVWHPLTKGSITGDDLVGLIATLDKTFLYEGSSNAQPVLVTEFYTERWHSGVVARKLQQYCR